ncbi:Ig-like domain-containing protein [Geomonas oryzae]|uniref:Ig-like domain-containing protein n=1 Tax=Geomonas oryzae TaxID=2364273 RepID=UPI0013A5E7B1|nr:Ig-like domain-containing protein [Geomonas oryzae]
MVMTLAACGGGGGGGSAVGGADSGAQDRTAPSVALTVPAEGTVVHGVTLIKAAASDDVGVARVEFYLDGALQGSTTTAPYSFSWDPSGVAKGSYNWTAKAYDAAGNVQTSAEVAVTVPIYAAMSTALSGSTAVGTVFLAGLPAAAPYGVNLLVSMPAGATLAGAVTSGPYAASGIAGTSGSNAVILASSSLASGEILKLSFTNIPAGAVSGDFAVAVSAVFDGGGTQIQ